MHVLSPGRNSPVFRHYWSAPPKKRVLEAIRRGFIRRTFPPGTSRHGKQNFLRRRPKVERLHDAQSLPEIQRLTFSRQRENYSSGGKHCCSRERFTGSPSSSDLYWHLDVTRQYR